MNILFGLLAELGENALRALRVKEGNHQVLSTFAGSLVDELDPCSLAFCECFGYVLYVECYVVYAAATAVLLDELSNRGLRAGRLKKFNLHFANFEERGLHLLVSHFLNAVAFATG